MCLLLYTTGPQAAVGDAAQRVPDQLMYAYCYTPQDRKLLSVTLRNVYRAETCTEEYKFTASGLYYGKTMATMDDFTTFIDSLPVIPLPEAFGLHENADITKDNNDTTTMCGSLLAMSGTGGGGGGSSVEDQVAAIVKEVE